MTCAECRLAANNSCFLAFPNKNHTDLFVCFFAEKQTSCIFVQAGESHSKPKCTLVFLATAGARGFDLGVRNLELSAFTRGDGLRNKDVPAAFILGVIVTVSI